MNLRCTNMSHELLYSIKLHCDFDIIQWQCSFLTFAHPEVLDTTHTRTCIFSFDKTLANCIEQYLIECNGSVGGVFD